MKVKALEAGTGEGPKVGEDGVMITFGPCGRISFDPPVTLEVAKAIKREIEEGIELANALTNVWLREGGDE